MDPHGKDEIQLSDQEAWVIKTLIDTGPSHGFELRRNFNELTGRSLSTATSYRILHRLEEAGLLESYWEQDGISHQGPRRRYYEVCSIAERVLKRHAEELARRSTGLLTPGFEGR